MDGPAPSAGSRACAGRGPACLRGMYVPGGPSGSSVLPAALPALPYRNPFPPDWAESPILARGCHSLQFSYCVPGGASWAASCLDRRRSQDVLMTGTPAPLFVSPGEGALGSLPVEHSPASSGQKGSSRRCPVVTAVGPPGKPAHRSRHRVCVPGIRRAALRASFWAGSQACRRPAGPGRWIGARLRAGPTDPSDLGTRWEAGAWPTCPHVVPPRVTRPRVRKRQAGVGLGAGGDMKLAPPRVPGAGRDGENRPEGPVPECCALGDGGRRLEPAAGPLWAQALWGGRIKLLILAPQPPAPSGLLARDQTLGASRADAPA